MAGAEAPNATSLVALAFAAAIAALMSWFDKRKARRDPEPSADAKTGQVLAASMIDTRSLRDAVEGMGAVKREIEAFREQQHDDSRALRSSIEELAIQLRRNTEAQGQGAVTPRDMAVLIANLKGIT